MTPRIRRAALVGLLVLCAASAEAQPAVRQVLVLQSFDRGSIVLDSFTGHFRMDVDERAELTVNSVQVVVGPTGFVGAAEAAVVAYIQATFAGPAKPDLIVTVGGPAAVFARTHRQQLFPETPLLLASVDQTYLANAPLEENEAAVAVINDFPQLVDEVLQLLPETKQVFMVMGSGPLATFWRRQLEAEFTRFRTRLTFTWSNDLSLQETLQRSANLPRNSAIIFLNLTTDSRGATYADERVLADLHATASAPLFSRHNVMLGHGVVGGRMIAIDDLGRATADAAVRILNGTPPGSVRVPPQVAGPPIFDWRELKKWGIAESRLPPGSIVRYRGPTLWSEYKVEALSALGALGIQSALIIGLLYQRRARQRAEFESRKNLALAADVSRRQTMSALTSSIAHELGQPLSAMMYNAQALQLMVASSPETSETLGEILSDIQAQGARATQIIERHRAMLRSRQLDRKPIDLHALISESLALVAHDMRARQVKVSSRLPPARCMVSGDQVLLQQVMINLVMNAMDAMTETPPGRRHLSIRSLVTESNVAVTVGDTGAGLPASINGQVFTPFVTTKSHGLGIGLTIARSIVDAHGGTLEARNNPEGGAAFTVTLPCEVSHGHA